MINPIEITLGMFCQQVTVPLQRARGSVAEVTAEEFLQEALINRLVIVSFSPRLRISKKMSQGYKMKQHLRIARYWFEATGPTGNRASVYVVTCLLGQVIGPSIRIQSNSGSKCAVINICNTLEF